MKKAYRIEISRYPAEDRALLGSPEELKRAYEEIHKEWAETHRVYYETSPNHSHEDYVRGLNFARIMSTPREIVSIEIGTQLTTGNLEDVVKQLGLPFDLDKVRYK